MIPGRTGVGAALAGTALLLGACSTPAPLVPDPAARQAWTERVARLEGLAGWTLAGRLAVRSGGASWSAGLRWRQRGTEARLRLTDPLGQGLYEIRVGPAGALLRSAAGAERRAPSAEALLRAETGQRLPLAGLRYWVEGRTRPDRPVEALIVDGQGRPTELAQGGWRVRYLGYQRVADLDLPRELELTHAALGVRAVVRRWRLEGGG